MAIFEKKKKETEETQPAGNAEPSVEKKGGKQPAEVSAADEAFFRVVRKPRITEKTTSLTYGRTYTFNVEPGVNKRMVKEAIEKKYRVSVVNVQTITIPRKKRMRGRMEGWKKGYKKALVKLKE